MRPLGGGGNEMVVINLVNQGGGFESFSNQSTTLSASLKHYCLQAHRTAW